MTQRGTARVQILAPANHGALAHRFDNPHPLGDCACTRGHQARHKRALHSVTPITSVLLCVRLPKWASPAPGLELGCRERAAPVRCRQTAMQVKNQRTPTGKRWAGRKIVVREHEGVVPQSQATALWQVGSSQHLAEALLACIDVGCAGLTGGQRRSKRKTRAHCQALAGFREACSQILLPPNPSAPHSTKTGTTGLTVAQQQLLPTVRSQEPLIAWSIVLSNAELESWALA